MSLPLRKDWEGNLLPTRYVRHQKGVTPEQFVTFAQTAFASEEYRHKMFFIGILPTTGLRDCEGCAINILDFMPEKYDPQNFYKIFFDMRNDFLKLHQFINDVMNCNFELFQFVPSKDTSENRISDKELPKSVAPFIKEMVIKNLRWIVHKNGFIFPKNNRYHPSYLSKDETEYKYCNCPKGTPLETCHMRFHWSPQTMQVFFQKKRELMHSMFPEMGFKDVFGYTYHGNVSQFNENGGGNRRPKYKFSIHTFRALHGTLAHLFDKDPLFSRDCLEHKSYKTTEKHYIKNLDFVEKRSMFVNKAFGPEYFDIMKIEGSKVVAVWDNLKNYTDKNEST